MAEQYGMRGKEVLKGTETGYSESSWRNTELRRNVVDDYEYYSLSFYTGDFEKTKSRSKNPSGSLGWSTSFIGVGIRLFLLYLYEKPLPSKAAARIAAEVGFRNTEDRNDRPDFEKAILEECSERKIREFWNYFQRWKACFPMEEAERKKYLAWAERIVYARADAIVSGQHRNQYGQVAALLAMAGEIKESMGMHGAQREIWARYKSKFPRHSSFQKEMRDYFNM